MLREGAIPCYPPPGTLLLHQAGKPCRAAAVHSLPPQLLSFSISKPREERFSIIGVCRVADISERLDMVEAFMKFPDAMGAFRAALRAPPDCERLLPKASPVLLELAAGCWLSCACWAGPSCALVIWEEGLVLCYSQSNLTKTGLAGLPAGPREHRERSYNSSRLQAWRWRAGRGPAERQREVSPSLLQVADKLAAVLERAVAAVDAQQEQEQEQQQPGAASAAGAAGQQSMWAPQTATPQGGGQHLEVFEQAASITDLRQVSLD
jgi:hypothetical protein